MTKIHKVFVEDIADIEIEYQLCGQYGHGVHKSLKFLWNNEEGDSWGVYDHRKLIGEYQILSEAVDHYNRIGRSYD